MKILSTVNKVLIVVIALVGLILVVRLFSCLGGTMSQPTDIPKQTGTPATPGTSPTAKPPLKLYTEPPPVVIDVNKKYTATIQTDKGNLVLGLYPKDAPKTVNNFVFLARDGFYNSGVFHRVIAGFMAQGGDPTGTGRGGPGYSFADEFSQRKHVTGSLSMANSGPNTNGSQFFICYAPQPHLDGKHSVFGQLTEGMDALKQLVNGSQIKTIVIKEE